MLSRALFSGLVSPNKINMIKPEFRAFVGGKMHTVAEILFESDRIHFGAGGRLGFPLSSVELMQYTGLNDVSGKKIFTGDILRITYGKRQFSAVVNYTLSYMGYSLGNPKCKMELAKYDNGSYIKKPALYEYVVWGFSNSPKLKVIGNIYENPELIN